ncbi:MAG: hypothetical protein NVSMB12_08930 [Acidimicrobiales bacterium]
MESPPPLAVRGQLASLGDALGGSWFLVERSTDGSEHSVGPTEGADGEDPTSLLRRAAEGGVVMRVEVGRRAHVALHDRAERAGDALSAEPVVLERILIGLGPDEGGDHRATRSLLAVVLQGVSAIADAADDAELARRKAELLELRAATDPLTGLLNRRGWDRLLAVEEDRCTRHRLDAEVIMVDLDGLKMINDTQGHEAGDAVIVRAATFIFSAVRIHDSVARLGGDEFAVLAVGADGSTGKVGRRIEMALAEADIAASLGWAARSERGSLAEAWRAADLRMYRVKQGHRAHRTPGPKRVSG